jgi:plasmid stabilization system protein ParE
MDTRTTPEIVRAQTLLGNLRRTPMLRGGRLSERRRLLKAHIESAIVDRGVPDRLAARIAFQLVLKCSPSQLGDVRVWSALGSLVREEVERLQQGLRLTDRLIRVGVPKLSADDMECLFNEMQNVDAKYGRTLAEAALDGADPHEMGRRYARAFTESVSRLAAKNPRIARTLAGAAFRSRRPLAHALAYLSRFDAIVHEFQGDVAFARTVAKTAFLAPDPVQAARQFVHDYHTVVRNLTTQGLEPTIARTLAGIASLGAEPLTAACALVEKFRHIEDVVKRSHPHVARSIALAACRATDPIDTARVYVANYERIVNIIGNIDPQRARRVANQAFRSDNPIAWARRFHREVVSSHGWRDMKRPLRSITSRTISSRSAGR